MMSWFKRKTIKTAVFSTPKSSIPDDDADTSRPTAGIFAKDNAIKPKLARREADRSIAGRLGLAALFRSKKNAGRKVYFALKPEHLENIGRSERVVLGGDLAYCDLNSDSPGQEFIAQATPRRGQGLLNVGGETVNIYVSLHEKVIEMMAENPQFKPILGMDAVLQQVYREAKNKIIVAVYNDGDNTCLNVVTTGKTGRVQSVMERRNQPDPIKKASQFAQELNAYVDEIRTGLIDGAKAEVILLGDLPSGDEFAGMTLLGTTPFFSRTLPPLDSGFKRVNPWAFILPAIVLLLGLAGYGSLIFWHKQEYNKAVEDFKIEAQGVAEARKTGNGETLEVLTQWKTMLERDDPQLAAAKELPALITRIAEIPNARISQFNHRFGTEAPNAVTKGPDEFTVSFNVPSDSKIPVVEQGDTLIRALSEKTGLELALVPQGYSEGAGDDIKKINAKRRSYTIKGGRRVQV